MIAIVVWGVITYTEDLLLFEENFEDSPHRQRLEGVVTIGECTLGMFLKDVMRKNRFSASNCVIHHLPKHLSLGACSYKTSSTREGSGVQA